MLRDSVVAVAVVRRCPRAIPLAMITMRKSSHGFPLFSYMSMGLRLAACFPVINIIWLKALSCKPAGIVPSNQKRVERRQKRNITGRK